VTQEIDKRLQGALLRIRGDHPFFGTLALFAEFRVSDTVPTAATDGKVLWFNPDFTAKQNPSQLCGLIAHELLHAALQHLPRRRERDPQLWNIAADIVVNGMVSGDTNYTLPEGGVENISLAHLSVEEIYEKLITGKLKVPKIGLLDLLGGGDHTAIDEEQQSALQRHWRAAVQQASAVARRMNKGFGHKGLDSLRDITEATAPSLNWREILWQFLVSTPCDFSGFDRRFIWQKLYLEDVVGETVEVAIVLDTSGSIGGDELGAFMTEIQGILDAYPQIQGNLFFADADLYGPHPFNQHVGIPAPKGGGGTSFVPFFDWVRKEAQDGSVPLCIYFTDGYGSFPGVVPDVPVLWVVIPGGLESRDFPFGTVARMGA
jgi:predicted metal-dependent peptidase